MQRKLNGKKKKGKKRGEGETGPLQGLHERVKRVQSRKGRETVHFCPEE